MKSYTATQLFVSNNHKIQYFLHHVYPQSLLHYFVSSYISPGQQCGIGHHQQDILKISEFEDLAHMIVHIGYQRHLLASRNVVLQSVDLNIYHQDLNNKTNNASMKLSTETHMLLEPRGKLLLKCFFNIRNSFIL